MTKCEPSELNKLPCECQYLEQTTDDRKPFIFNDNGMYEYFMMGFILLVYSLVLIYLFTLRNEVSFKARSPKLITLGVLLLCADQIGNTYIYSGSSEVSHWNHTCNMQIIVTNVFYMGSIMVYFVRMYRIYKVYTCYNRYLQEQTKVEVRRSSSLIIADSTTSTESILADPRMNRPVSQNYNSLKISDKQYIADMMQLKEETLLRKSIQYFLIPSILLGAIGCYFPYVYAMLPGNESDLCVCSFFQAMKSGQRDFPILKSRTSYPIITILNALTTMTWEFGSNVLLLSMVYKIRHIQDDTMIKLECVVFTLLMVFIDLIIYLIYILG